MYDYPKPWTYDPTKNEIIDATGRPVCWLPYREPVSDDHPNGYMIEQPELDVLAARILDAAGIEIGENLADTLDSERNAKS